MYQAVRELAKLTDLHLVALLDDASERDEHAGVDEVCMSTEYLVRMSGRQKTLGSLDPHAVREFANPDLEWVIHRQIYTRFIDVIQLEYANLGQYAGQFQQLVCAVFEHDIYFQSIARGARQTRRGIRKLSTAYEYLRALRYELRMLRRADQVQVCSRENRMYLESFLPELKGRIQDGLRAGIDTSDYSFRPEGREPLTMLFLGSFRHIPNVEALEWFVRGVLPRVLERQPKARLIVIGSDPPPRHSLPHSCDAIELRGFVENIREPLERYAVFVCPILSGSGVRVKLLEAFASGIPVVSTRLGAEGLASDDGVVCALADDPDSFAERILHLFQYPEKAAAMAKRAREHVAAERDIAAMMKKLEEGYRVIVNRKRSAISPQGRA
jgi:glycosyltransferase involved in cell wall biosynthesis